MKPEETVTPEETVKPEETVTPEEAVTPEETAEPEAAAVSESAPEKETRVATSDVVIGEEMAGYTYELLDKAPMKTSAKASSQQSGTATDSDGPAGNAFDGSLDRAWHTAYGENTLGTAHAIEWNLKADGSAVQVGKLTYQPKHGGNNGRWKVVDVQVQKADDNWTSVYSGSIEELPSNGNYKAIINFIPVEAKAMKVIVTESFGDDGKHYAHAGEIEVYEAISDEQSSTAKTVEIPQSTLAKNATATSSKDPVEWGDGGATLAFDNDLGTAWHAAYDNAKYPISIEFNVDESPDMCQKISKMTIQSKRNGDNGNIKAGVVSVLNAKGQWEDVRDLEYTEADKWQEHTIDMKNVVGSKIRITVTEAWNDNTSLKVANIGEIHVWKVDEQGVPSEPQIDYNEEVAYKINYIFEDEENVAGNRQQWLREAKLVDTVSGETRGGDIIRTTAGGHFPTSDSYTITVPKYVNKVETNWEVENPGGDDMGVPGVNSYYETVVEKNGAFESTVTFKLNVVRAEKTVKVNWVNVSDKDKKDINVRLNKSSWYDGLAFTYGDDIKLTAENGYTYTWTDLPTYYHKDYKMYVPCFSIDPIEERWMNNSLDGLEVGYSVEGFTPQKDMVYRFDPHGNSEIVITIGKAVDKTELQNLYNETGKYITSLPDTNGFVKKYNEARANAGQVLQDATATDEQVLNAKNNLELRYWACRVAEKNTQYSVEGAFDWSGCTTESVRPLAAAYMAACNININKDRVQDIPEIKQWFADYEAAEKLLVEAPADPHGMMVGINKEMMAGTSKERGTINVSESTVQDEEGNLKIRLHIEYINDGKHPIRLIQLPNGEPCKESQINGISVSLEHENGITPVNSEKRPLDGETDLGKGFQMDVDVDPGSYIVTMYSSKSPKLDVATIGTYHTNIPVKPVDKTALQRLYDEVKDFTADTAWLRDFTNALKKAKEVLDNADATQKEVDDAYNALEQRYWLCQVGAYTNKYRAQESSGKELFPYEEYTRDSALAMIKVWSESANANQNTKVENLKNWHAAFQEAEKGLVRLQEDPRGVWGGPAYQDMRTNFTNTFKGSFKVTETPADNGMINLHVEFINDGINPYTGEKSDPYTYAQMGSEGMTGKEISAHYTHRNYDGTSYFSGWGEPKHLDGEDDFIKGFQMDITNVKPGKYYFSMSTRDNKGSVHTAGYYYTRESVTVTTSVDGTETKLPLFKGEALGDQFPADPTKDGYVFMGWNTKADGSGTVVTKDTKFDANAIVYALFKEELHAKADYSNVKDGKLETVYNGKVTVTITTNKDVPNLDGWKKVNDRTFTKVFTKNAEETVVLRDVDGFECTVNVKVEGIVIDHTNPTIQVDKDGTVTVKDDNLSKVTVDGKEVTLDKNGQFVLSEGEHTIVAVDKAGNSVTWVGKIGGSGSGNSQKPEDDKKPGQGSDDSQQGGNAQQQTGGQAAGSQSAKTGDQAQIGLYVVLLLGCAAVIGVLIYKKKKN